MANKNETVTTKKTANNGTSTTALALTADALANQVGIQPALAAEYIKNGYTSADDVQYVEQTATLMLDIQTQAVQGAIQLGERLAHIKETVNTGGWGYALERMGLDAVNSSRFISMYNSTTRFPQLAAVAGRLSGVVLAQLGRTSGKIADRINDDVINEVAGRAADGMEVTLDDVKHIVDTKGNTVEPKVVTVKAKVYPFKLVVAEPAREYLAQLAHYATSTYSDFKEQTALDPAKLLKDHDFRAMCKRIADGMPIEDSQFTELETALCYLLATVYVARVSVENAVPINATTLSQPASETEANS